MVEKSQKGGFYLLKFIVSILNFFTLIECVYHIIFGVLQTFFLKPNLPGNPQNRGCFCHIFV
jgi:hypothetical protein